MKEIKDFPGYFVTEDGKVCSAWKRRFTRRCCKSYLDYNNLRQLKPILTHKGYYAVRFKKNGKQYTKTIHRLVAETYISNPNNLPQVNHIDENKINNFISNLEWCTNHQNAIHSKCRYEWKVENITTGEIHTIINLAEFCRCNEIYASNLKLTLTGKISQHKNFKLLSQTQFK
tara:strand:+ start:130 stop:648 length:519 start_codon:yes stop_codon:yes gene_type:complete